MLTIEHLVKSYGGDVRAVDDLSIDVQPGDIYGFIGHNGAGKTTTLRAVAGILSFDSGNIRINGRSITDDPIACKREMAYIPDNPDLYDHLTGIQYFNFVADIYGVSNADRDARIKKYADAFEMTPRLNDLIGSCSHGMKQKIAVISALIHMPKLLILDEPFVGLDPKAAHTLKGFMKELCDGGSAIFFSTHVLEVAEKLCNKIAIIKQGKLIAAGNMDAVKGDESLETLFLELTDNA
ncbi:ABC-type transporter ATP-binding protein EcsA [bioreactor metagenome]|uniref:ABC-type transporter ATP-binding protein EcsA n=1 Tax=bioreactor metagenome TaxID=1076179 RepID=A0A644WUZ1_9ZZZZ